jgi:predicted ribosomally synthesized peptide with SipW-like signal peptide
MKTAKLGAIFLISIMALAGVGAGYAAWTDTITIDGTVNTGNVDLVIMYLSSTYVYKNTLTDDCVAVYVLADLNGVPVRQFVYDPETGTGTWYPDVDANMWTLPVDFLLVASSVATKITDDEVSVTATGLFPCITFGVDILLHYDGSIPVKINDAWISTNDAWLQTLIDSGEAAVSVWESNEYGNLIAEIPYDEILGYQIHYCEWIMVIIGIHLPQEDALMGQTASFTGKLEVIQWNEYP